MVFESAPRSLASRKALAQRLERVREPHVRALNDLVDTWRAQVRSIPYFDPDSGGVDARVLLLLEAPGPKAAPHPNDPSASSGLVSLDNNDQTASRLFQAVAASGLSRTDVLIWNIVPWYLGEADHSRIRATKREDIEAAADHLQVLLGKLKGLRVVVLLGEKAQRGWLLACEGKLIRLPILPCPHPSLQSVNRDKGRSKVIEQALTAANRYVTSSA